MSKNTGGPAFPFPPFTQPNHEFCWGHDGMTLRDYFAAKATEEDIQSVMSFGEAVHDPCDRAAARFRHADAMLAERGK